MAFDDGNLVGKGIRSCGKRRHQLGPRSIAEIIFAHPSRTRLARVRKRSTSRLNLEIKNSLGAFSVFLSLSQPCSMLAHSRAPGPFVRFCRNRGLRSHCCALLLEFLPPLANLDQVRLETPRDSTRPSATSVPASFRSSAWIRMLPRITGRLMGGLIARASRGFVFLAVVMGLFLFVPAGTLGSSRVRHRAPCFDLAAVHNARVRGRERALVEDASTLPDGVVLGDKAVADRQRTSVPDPAAITRGSITADISVRGFAIRACGGSAMLQSDWNWALSWRTRVGSRNSIPSSRSWVASMVSRSIDPR
jgi:hypothetical protein